ncbi:MAG TPA: energy transducer TonB [Terriglobales bacterium]|nr:energy transducer TonB [Terriglobales bacterium]
MGSIRPLVVLLLVVLSSTAFAQTASAALPADPLELATGDTLKVANPENRALVLSLLERARQNGSELYAAGGPAFHLKLSFTSSGQSRYAGSGEMDEIRYSRNTSWRWTARLGEYSQVRVFQYGIPYDEKTAGPIPLRVQMVRGAVLWPMFNVRPGTMIRMASAQWRGMEVMCALLSFDEAITAAHGRHWEEREYCVDTKSALLRIYSEAPGIYTLYDYGEAVHFHGRTLARQISIVESGDTVLQIHIDSLEDAGAADPALFTPTKEMLARGPGIVLMASVRISAGAATPAGHTGKIEPVIVHASIDDQGKVVEAETLQSSDPSLSNAALALVKSSTYPPQTRATGPVQTEAFINVEFVGGAR